LGTEFPYTLETVCYIGVTDRGSVSWGRDTETYERALAGDVRLYAVWPGKWSSHLFVIDDLDQYARAFGIVHDPVRTGLADHEHQVRWAVSSHETRPNGAYISIDVSLDCDCEIRDLEAFARVMQQQAGWDVATTSGWGSSGAPGGKRRYYMRVRRKSLSESAS
jgi:hypothetical protein